MSQQPLGSLRKEVRQHPHDSCSVCLRATITCYYGTNVEMSECVRSTSGSGSDHVSSLFPDVTRRGPVGSQTASPRVHMPANTGVSGGTDRGGGG